MVAGLAAALAIAVAAAALVLCHRRRATVLRDAAVAAAAAKCPDSDTALTFTILEGGEGSSPVAPAPLSDAAAAAAGKVVVCVRMPPAGAGATTAAALCDTAQPGEGLPVRFIYLLGAIFCLLGTSGLCWGRLVSVGDVWRLSTPW